METAPRRSFASALEWPGWSRPGRDEAGAMAALASSAGRFAIVARGAGLAFGPLAPDQLEVVERRPGTATTAFGAPDVVFSMDQRPTDRADGERLCALVRASWDYLGRVAASAPSELRKGSRGGGRDLGAIVVHVVAAEAAYARRIGVLVPEPAPGDMEGVAIVRAAIVDAVVRPTDGGPIPGGRWTVRYAARRIAWHVLDHAWEIQDRAEPA